MLIYVTLSVSTQLHREVAEMPAPNSIPQTLTTMEACFTVEPGAEDEFWRAQERMGPVAAAQPGFLAVIGGPIYNSSWLYFCGKFETPELMDEWHHSRRHRPVQDMAYKKWFGAYYIRKWRVPAEGEEISGRVFVETEIVREKPFEVDELETVTRALDKSFQQHDPLPFETMTGQFEAQPYQLVGPLQEFPEVAPARYLLLTHWSEPGQAAAWQQSPEAGTLEDMGRVSHQVNVPLYQEPGTRNYVRADRMQREWARHPAPAG